MFHVHHELGGCHAGEMVNVISSRPVGLLDQPSETAPAPACG